MSKPVKAKSIIINPTTFNSNTTIQSINCSNREWLGKSMSYAFNQCTNLTQITNINNNVENLSYAFKGCSNLTSIPDIPANVTNMERTFDGCSSLTGNINILSTKITKATNCFVSTTATKYVYIEYNTTTHTSFTNAGYDENGTKQGVYLRNIRGATLTINPTPSDATVTLTATGYTQVGNSITVPYGTTVNYTVSKNGYNTETGSQVVNTINTVNVTLTAFITYTINPDPANATVTLTSSGSTQTGNSITVPYGSTIDYTVSATGYTSQSGTYTATANKTEEIVLKYETNTVLFESNTPGTYTLDIDTSRGNTYQIDVVGAGGSGMAGNTKAGDSSSHVVSRGGTGPYVVIEIPNTELAKTNANGTWTFVIGYGGTGAFNVGSTTTVAVSTLSGNVCVADYGKNSNTTAKVTQPDGGTYTITSQETGFIVTGTNGNQGAVQSGYGTIYNNPSPYDTQHGLGATYGYGGGASSGNNFQNGGAGYIKVTVTS